MPELRRVLERAGFGPVATYLQSGNAILQCEAAPDVVESACEAALREHLGLSVDVVVRDRGELGSVLRRDPFRGVANNPKRYLVVFFRDAAPAGLGERLERLAAPSEAFAVSRREAYIWTPESVQRSNLWNPAAGVVATARNWTTVQALHALLEVREGATPRA